MYEGWTVPIEYDPLLAKLVGYGEDREQAINRLLRALYEYFVGGIKTNISLFRRILKDPDFQAGNIDTGFLDRLLTKPSNETDVRRPIIAAIGAAIFASMEPKATLPGGTTALRRRMAMVGCGSRFRIGGARRGPKRWASDKYQHRVNHPSGEYFMEMVLNAVFEEVAESEGGGYVAYVEELPGAISEGDTLEEARENLRDAICVTAERESAN